MEIFGTPYPLHPTTIPPSPQLYLLFPFKHQDGTLGDDKVFVAFINYFGRTAEQKDRQVTFLCLERHVFDLLFFRLPRFIIHRHWNRIARPGFNNKSLLYFFFFLYTRRKIQATFSSFVLPGRPDKNPVAYDDKLLEFVFSWSRIPQK